MWKKLFLSVIAITVLLFSCAYSQQNTQTPHYDDSDYLDFFTKVAPRFIDGFQPDKDQLKYDGVTDQWFHKILVTADKRKAFYIAKDLSAVYELGGTFPILRYGSAQPMLDYYFRSEQERNFVSAQDNAKGIVGMDSPIITEIIPTKVFVDGSVNEGGIYDIKVQIAGGLQYDLTLESTNVQVARIKDRKLHVLKPGSGEIKGTLSVDGSVKKIRIPFSVAEPEMSCSLPDRIEIGETLPYTLEILHTEKKYNLSMTADNPEIIKIADGTITGLSKGNTKITVVCAGIGREEMSVEVVDPSQQPDNQTKGHSLSVWITNILAVVLIVFVIFRLANRFKNKR